MTPTPFQLHRSTCTHCRTMPYLCADGGRILRQSMQWWNSGGTGERARTRGEQ